MKKLMAVVALACLASSLRPASASDGGPVKVLTVYDEGRSVISLSDPGPFTREDIEVESAGSHLEVMAQLELTPGECLLFVSELDNLVVTALASNGVVGRPRPGGYEIVSSRREAVMLRLSGALPPGRDRTTLLDITWEQNDRVRTLLSITVSPEPPPGILATVWAFISPWGSIGIVLAVAGLFVWRRLRRGTSFWEEMDG